MLFNLYFLYLILASFMILTLSLEFILTKDIILIEWMFYSINSCLMKFIIYVDWMMLMFIGVVMFISSMVMLYSKEYMLMELKKKYFVMILMMFVVSMIFMIMSPNIISIILGWDGLGLISYCLIIYYQNLNSYNSGMLTLLTNRIGDIMLIMMIFLMISIGSWNLMNYLIINKMFMFMLLIMLMTKSAQIPFSMWLPAAMAAPTPVSSLVHSSTLVTAGIYLLIRFNKLFLYNNLNYCMMFIGLMTMLISSLNALIEFDFKKIIAFSTLSQLGLMMMMGSMSLTNYVFFHLISHAMFKSLLFLCSGVMIHFMKGIQDIRYMGGLINEIPLIIMFFNFSNLSLSGFPFFSGFYSKDLMYEMSLNYNLNLYLYYFMFMCISFTVSYSLRLVYYLTLNLNCSFSLMMKYDNFIMSSSMFLLFSMTLIFGSLINWLLFSSLSMSLINFKIKFILYYMMLFGIYMIMHMMNMTINMSLYELISKFSLFFYLLKLTLMNNLKIIKMSGMIINLNEMGWNEYYGKMFNMYMLKMLNKMFITMFFNKYIFIFLLFIYLYLIFYLFF
uniref:NADH:ubiquinone reductase (H(+)-translocating) n=1 Tax=Alloxysta sp. ZJUH_2016001 TaxID=2491149 RepID=A0A3Q8U9T5_9HYME|nr:NADH dehydrogenase subunit 5 [Alloxysta sp. ZJUH_2016001]